MTTTRKFNIATIAVYLAIALLVRSTSRGAEIESGDANSFKIVDVTYTGPSSLIVRGSYPSTVEIVTGYVSTVKIGDAKLTKNGALRTIARLKFAVAVCNFAIKRTISSRPSDLTPAMLAIEDEGMKMLEAARASLIEEIAEQQKLADALALEVSK